MKRVLLLIYAMLGVYAICHAQADYLPTPPSINAQSFMQNINHPVSHYTGTVNVEIPLCTIELKDISVPVSLTYNTSGIKVEQEASTVGLGWSLNVGGAITKTILGENDMYERHTYFNTNSCAGSPHITCNSLNDITRFYGPIEKDFTLADYLSPNATWSTFVHGGSYEEGFNGLNNSVYNSSAGGKEFAPDLFSYSFGPYSGTFIFDRQRNIVKEKEDDVILTPSFNNNQTDITQWDVTTPNGTKYIFAKAEKVEFKPYWACNDCWYLTRIETTGGSVLLFNYMPGPTHYKTFNRYQESGPEGTNNAEQIKYNTYENSLYISSITYNGGSIAFNYAVDRDDAEWLPRLVSVERYVGASKTTIWEMNQSYFHSNRNDFEIPTVSRLQQLGMDDFGYDNDWNTKRLRLDAIQVIPTDYSDTATFKLDYNETYLPTKLSTAVDHWGYYNGQYNGSLIGIQNHYIDGPDGKSMSHGGSANREIYEPFNQAYSLKRLTYPTGGYTEFTYESNEYDTANMEGDPYKMDYYYSPITNSVYEGEGYHNVPGTAVSSKTISVSCPPKEPTRETRIHYKVIVNPSLYNSYYAWDMSLTLSFSNWSKTLIAPELPQRGQMTPETCIFEGWATTRIPNGSHILSITGSLRQVLDESFLEVTYYQTPEEYIASHSTTKAGGLRIKEIKTFSDLEICTSRKVHSYSSNGKSTGKLMSFPRYNTGFRTYSSKALRNNGPSVGYSKVMVTDMDNVGNSYGRVEYEYINKPDSNYCYSWESTLVNLGIVTGYSVDANPTGVMPHKHQENGLLLQESTYDSAGNLINRRTNEYSIDNSQWRIIWGIAKEYRNIDLLNAKYWTQDEINALRRDPSIGPHLINGNGIPMGYVYPAIQPTFISLQKSINTKYENGNPIVTSNSYSYAPGHSNIVQKETVSLSDGNHIETDYYYPFDFDDSVMQQMTLLNMISTPVVTEISRNGTMIEERKDTYSLFGNLSSPKLSMQSSRTTANGEFVTERTILAYDAKSNPQWINSKGLDVVYIWGYEGQYPIAEIKNATLEQVKAALGSYWGLISSSLTSSSPIYPTMDKLDALRTSLPDAKVTTITYKPGIGPTSITDPRGIIKNYYYDNLGRLTKITEKANTSAQENIISSHSYNYANK